MEMFTPLVLATVINAVITLLPLWHYEAWWIRIFDFPRMQFITAIIITLLLAITLLDLSRGTSLLLVIINSGCLLYHGWWIWPYSRLYPVEVKASTTAQPTETIKILASNVLMPNRHAECLLALMAEHQPDLLVTLESDLWWQTQLTPLEKEYPYTLQCPLDNLYGMHVYSRFPLEAAEIKYLVEPDVPSMHCLVILPSGNKIRTHFLHPAPPSPTENDSSSERDAELLAVANSIADATQPIIVAGDLNDVAWSNTTRLFRKVSGLRDPRIGRGMFNTFHAGYWFIRWPLDHLFHSHHFRVITLKRLKLTGSDHFALLSHLELSAQQDNGQARLNASQDDKVLARQKMAEQGVSKKDIPSPH